ncbi:Mediator of RNA polymerase II transcription subunit 7 [Pleurotus pulmonarius]|nr:Mediator of RNA polymerase II transcription subunit 7 [Pleurotus pulmonarius]KAF4605017.1 Mediator of RNA polymerase II transcription subunit 7 [Pleurotus pulmonarius]KAF4606511.1 Mediator of RNA polymerase II transcription subunit 7 [Pleurotus pulmonarius]
MDDEEAELRNPFPSPPSHYVKYTPHNLNLLALLKERAPDDQNPNQYDVLRDQTDIPEWPLTQLEKPRVDWILEEPDPYYEVYGERWPLKDSMPSLGEMGGLQLYPEDPSVDRRPALRSALRSLLVTYSAMTKSLLAPAPINADVPPEWGRHAEWIDVMAQNMMFAANELRPIQARASLEGMMKRQIELRREETATLHSKCDSLEAKLAELRAVAHSSTQAPVANSEPTPSVSILSNQRQIHIADASQSGGKPPEREVVDQVDVLRWAEEVN